MDWLPCSGRCADCRWVTQNLESRPVRAGGVSIPTPARRVGEPCGHLPAVAGDQLRGGVGRPARGTARGVVAGGWNAGGLHDSDCLGGGSRSIDPLRLLRRGSFRSGGLVVPGEELRALGFDRARPPSHAAKFVATVELTQRRRKRGAFRAAGDGFCDGCRRSKPRNRSPARRPGAAMFRREAKP